MTLHMCSAHGPHNCFCKSAAYRAVHADHILKSAASYVDGAHHVMIMRHSVLLDDAAISTELVDIGTFLVIENASRVPQVMTTYSSHFTTAVCAQDGHQVMVPHKFRQHRSNFGLGFDWVPIRSSRNVLYQQKQIFATPQIRSLEFQYVHPHQFPKILAAEQVEASGILRWQAAQQ